MHDNYSVTTFGDFSPLWQNIQSLGQVFQGLFTIWQNFGPTLVNFVCPWANFRWWKWPNAEKESSHLVTLVTPMTRRKKTVSLKIAKSNHCKKLSSASAIGCLLKILFWKTCFPKHLFVSIFADPPADAYLAILLKMITTASGSVHMERIWPAPHFSKRSDWTVRSSQSHPTVS